MLETEPALDELFAGKVAGTDYWLNFSALPRNERGERLTGITIVFERPFSLTGNVPTFSDPCKGAGDEGHVPEDHPCRVEPRTYPTVTVEWHIESRELHVFVDLDRKAVVDVFNPGISDDSVDDLIAVLDDHYDGSY